jgi:hypothetical protein
MQSVLDGIVQAIPAEEAALLSLSAVWDSDDDLIMNDMAIHVLPGAIREVLEEKLADRARLRNISHFIPKLFR